MDIMFVNNGIMSGVVISFIENWSIVSRKPQLTKGSLKQKKYACPVIEIENVISSH